MHNRNCYCESCIFLTWPHMSGLSEKCRIHNSNCDCALFSALIAILWEVSTIQWCLFSKWRVFGGELLYFGVNVFWLKPWSCKSCIFFTVWLQKKQLYTPQSVILSRQFQTLFNKSTVYQIVGLSSHKDNLLPKGGEQISCSEHQPQVPCWPRGSLVH